MRRPAGCSREGRAFVDISGGPHASEVAGARHTIQLAGTFRVLFNALLYAGQLAAKEHGDPDFWSAPDRPATDEKQSRERQ